MQSTTLHSARFLAFFVAFMMISCVLGNNWEVTPRSAAALSKGKNAAKSSMASLTTIATGTTTSTSVPKGVVTPDGTTLFWDVNGAQIELKGVRPDTGAIFSCWAPSTGYAVGSFDPSAITSNGYTIYASYNAVLFPITVAPTLLSTPGKKSPKSSYGQATCSKGSDVSGVTGTLQGTGDIGSMLYVAGKIYYGNWNGVNNVIDKISSTSNGAAVTTGAIGIVGSSLLAGVACTAAKLVDIIGIAYLSNFLYVYAGDGTDVVMMKVNLACTGTATDVVIIAGGSVGASAHVGSTTGTSAHFYAANGGYPDFYSCMAVIGDYLYVGSGYGIVSVSTVAPYAVSNYIVGSDTVATGVPVDSVGSYATTYGPTGIIGSPPSVSGVLYIADFDGSNHYTIRKMTWAGDAKTKVKIVNPAKAGKGKV